MSLEPCAVHPDARRAMRRHSQHPSYMSVPLRRFQLAVGFLFSVVACRHENFVGEGVALRAQCTGSPTGSVVSDFESGTPTLLAVDGRGGTSWSLATNSGLDAAGLTMEVVQDPTSPSGKNVLWIHGAAANMPRYLQADFAASSSRQAYDISDCTAIEVRGLWQGTGSALFFSIGDVDTVPAGGVCGVADAGLCHDDFGTTLALSSTWQDLRVPFSSFRQSGFGEAFPALVTSKVYGPQFTFPAGDTVDLRIDDITLR
jgi:hypothetical protein